MENGQEWYYKTTPGEELLGTARMLRKYLKDTERSTGKFISLYSQAQPITPEEYRHLIHLRMENTGKVTGVFDLDFDKPTPHLCINNHLCNDLDSKVQQILKSLPPLFIPSVSL